MHGLHESDSDSAGNVVLAEQRNRAEEARETTENCFLNNKVDGSIDRQRVPTGHFGFFKRVLGKEFTYNNISNTRTASLKSSRSTLMGEEACVVKGRESAKRKCKEPVVPGFENTAQSDGRNGKNGAKKTGAGIMGKLKAFKVSHAAGALNVRSSPDTDSPLLRKIYLDEIIAVSAERLVDDHKIPGLVHRRVKLADGTGWVTHSTEKPGDKRVYLTECSKKLLPKGMINTYIALAKSEIIEDNNKRVTSDDKSGKDILPMSDVESKDSDDPGMTVTEIIKYVKSASIQKQEMVPRISRISSKKSLVDADADSKEKTSEYSEKQIEKRGFGNYFKYAFID